MASTDTDRGEETYMARLPLNLVEEIRELAVKHDRSLSAELREALRHYLKTVTVALLALVALALPGAAQAETPLEQAAATIQHQARHYPGSRDNRISWAIFRWVNTNIRSERATRIADPSKLTDINQAIRLRAGSCGTATTIALKLADRLDAEARPVEFYYTEPDGTLGSHIMPEFKVNGEWRLMDVLFNAVYRSPVTHKLLSARQVFAMPYRSAIRRQQTFPDTGRDLYKRGKSPWKAPHNPFRYLADPRSQMTINDHGTITWPSHTARANIPNYIGQAASFGARRANLSARFTRLTANTITVRLTSGCSTGRIVAQSRTRSTAPVQSSTTTVTLPVSGPNVVISIEGGCYAVLQGIAV